MQRKLVRTGENLLQIELRCPKQIEAGGTIRFSAFFLSLKDGPFNPTSIAAKVYEGTQMANLRATLVPIQDNRGIGSYFADYAVPPSQPTGPLAVVWTGSYMQSDELSSYALQATQIFRAINPPAWV